MFDPYHKWLGIPTKDQPPNHYRLLGIELFETDADVIDAAANKQMAYIQGCATGPHIALSQKLLNEIAAARLCLLTPAKKADYDAKLKANLPKFSIPLAMPIAVAPPSSSQAITANTPAPVSPKPPHENRDSFDALASDSVEIRKRPKRRSKKWPVILGGAFLGVVGLVIVAVYSLGILNPSKTDNRQAEHPGKKAGEQKKSVDKRPTELSGKKAGEQKKSNERDNKWAHLNVQSAKVESDFIRIAPQSVIQTKENHTGPIEVVVVARTEKNNIRLYAFNGACVIFNWENRREELRVTRPDGNDRVPESGSLATAKVQPLEANTWYTLRWRITAEGMEVAVDGKRVFSEKRVYDLSAKRPVMVAAAESVVDVKSFDAKPYSGKNESAVKPKEIHILAVIDGTDTLRLSEKDALWIHGSYQWPPSVKINNLDWNPKANPRFAQAGISQLFQEKVDFSTATLSIKNAGRQQITLGVGDSPRSSSRVQVDDE